MITPLATIIILLIVLASFQAIQIKAYERRFHAEMLDRIDHD